MKDIRQKAKELMRGACRLCPICDGRVCAGEVPGMGGLGSGSAFKNNVKALAEIALNMDACRDALIQNGIWLCQYPVPVEQPNAIGLVTKLTHAESGQWQSSLAVVPLPKADPQGMGSAITYARRYALESLSARHGN
jgi:ERF superfamily.